MISSVEGKGWERVERIAKKILQLFCKSLKAKFCWDLSPEIFGDFSVKFETLFWSFFFKILELKAEISARKFQRKKMINEFIFLSTFCFLPFSLDPNRKLCWTFIMARNGMEQSSLARTQKDCKIDFQPFSKPRFGLALPKLAN